MAQAKQFNGKTSENPVKPENSIKIKKIEKKKGKQQSSLLLLGTVFCEFR